MIVSAFKSIPVLLALVLVLVAAPAARAQTCTGDDFGKVVDGAGAAMRAFNAEAAPKLQSRLKALAAKKGWAEAEFEDTAITYLRDDRMARLDETSNGLLAKVDTLGRLEPGQAPDCAKLDELRTAGIELLAVMKAKSAYIIAKIDTELGTGTAATTAAPNPPPAPVTTAEPAGAPKERLAAPAPQVVPGPAVPGSQARIDNPVKKPAAGIATWTTTSQTNTPASPGTTGVAVLTQPPPAAAPAPGAAPPTLPDGSARPLESMRPPAAVLQPDDGYTIDEIRDATRGFFGTISTSLAAVVEHAFQKSGRPTAYILGQEGGGAFLGGLRYGEGTLYVRSGGAQRIYWHGPSIGFDFGAAGTRTMFLVYKMREPDDLYRVFTGIDGSAFVVGGVGFTLLGGGGMLLAPIRSGIGVRVGANVGYLRFTAGQTWNPF